MATYMPVTKLLRILKSADKSGQMNAQIIGNVLALGTGLNPTLSVDFSNETVRPYNGSAPYPTAARPSHGVRSPRRSGRYWMELAGQIFEFGSLRDLLGESLQQIEKRRPGTLEKLSHIKPKSKRIVARNKKLLFDTEHLVNKYGAELMEGWWYGTNNSTQETRAWLERACECADLKWGADFQISF